MQPHKTDSETKLSIVAECIERSAGAALPLYASEGVAMPFDPTALTPAERPGLRELLVRSYV